MVTVIVELPEPATEAGLKLAPAPDGRPDVTPKVTVPLKLFCGVTVIELVPLLPWVAVTLPDAERLKFCWVAAFTVRLTVVE